MKMNFLENIPYICEQWAKVEVRFVQPQTFALYRDMKILDGASPNQIKPIHVISNEKLKRFFFALLQR